MTIGFDGSRAFTSKRTGTENYSYQLLKALAKIDSKNQYIVYLRASLSVIATPRSGEAIYSKQDRHVAGAPRDDDYKWPENFKFQVIKWPRLWTQGGLSLQTFKDNLDVLFVPAHTLPVIRKPGLKTVVTVHDLGSEYLPQMHQIKQRAYLGLMQKFQLKTATKIIAVSKATKEDLVKRMGIKPENVTVVYEGYNRDIFRPIPYTLNPKPYFLFVGTIQPRKNLERIIRAFAKIEDKSLVIAGSKGWMSDKIYELPKKLGIENRVKFLGYVADEKLPALYSGAEALIFPSLFEGFGLPILEAQACGCPVITSNISSMPEVAGDGAVYVNPYSIEDIIDGIRKIEDGRLRMEKIKQGFENIKKFSWEKCAKETLEVLISI